MVRKWENIFSISDLLHEGNFNVETLTKSHKTTVIVLSLYVLYTNHVKEKKNQVNGNFPATVLEKLSH